MAEEMDMDDIGKMMEQAFSGQPLPEEVISFVAVHSSPEVMAEMIEMIGYCVTMAETMIVENQATQERLSALDLPYQQKAAVRAELEKIDADTRKHLESSRRALAIWTGQVKP